MKFDDFSPVIPDETQEIAIKAEKARENFQRLYSKNLNSFTATKNGMAYLNWATCWKEMKLAYPEATYRIICHPTTYLPYFSSELGIFVMVEVTAGGITLQQHLPILDASNRPMKETPYKISVYNKYEKKYEEKTVAAATSFDINSGLMRALSKCISLWGIGLYLYEGNEMPNQLPSSADATAPSLDIPTPQEQDDFNVGVSEKKATNRRKKAAPADPFAAITTIINGTTDMKALVDLYLAHKQEVDNNLTLLEAFTRRKIELQGFAA